VTRLLTAKEMKRVFDAAAAYFRQTNGASMLVCRRVFEATTYRIDDACLGRCFNEHTCRSVDELCERLTRRTCRGPRRDATMSGPSNKRGTKSPTPTPPKDDASDVDSCRLGRCLSCGGQWPRHITTGCKGRFPRIMEYRQLVHGERKEKL
jgi:hypothetical protein